MMRELGIKKLRVGWGVRAVRFEERIVKGMGGNILRQYWAKKEEGEWTVWDKKGYFNKNGWELKEMERIKRKERDLEVRLIYNEKEVGGRRKIGKRRLNIIGDIRNLRGKKMEWNI